MRVTHLKIQKLHARVCDWSFSLQFNYILLVRESNALEKSKIIMRALVIGHLVYSSIISQDVLPSVSAA